MKKTVFLLAVLSALLQPLSAQDTIRTHDMRTISRYFVPVWPDAFPSVTIDREKYERGYLNILLENWNSYKEAAWQLYTDDTLQVYGIAACLTTSWRFHPEYYDDYPSIDTSHEFVYNYLRLYEADPDSLRHIGDELLVHLQYTPVSYYIDLGLLKSNYSVQFHPILPMYERYFSSPVTVADSFYVGLRYRPDHHSGQEVGLIQLADSLMYGRRMLAWYEDYIWNNDLFGIHDSVVKGWFYQNWTFQEHPFLFPIIAPPDTVADTTIHFADTVVNGSVVVRPGNTVVITPGDTLIVGGDTLVNPGGTVTVTPGDTVVIGGDTLIINVGDTLFVNPGDTLFVNPDGSIVINPGGTVVVSPGEASGVGIRGVDLLYRYTAVMPNPARHRATITSSFGLTQIDLYDARGRLLKTFPASGLKADLDLSAFPPGTYLLRILTPAGPTTKKLLLQ